MFEDSNIDKYSYGDMPLDRDCLQMSEVYIEEFDQSLVKMLQGESCNPYEVGCVSPIAIRKIHNNSIELSWYANTHTRFHEVSISLPKEKIKTCVGCWQYDIKPYIFVDHEWLEQLYLRQYSVFALVDAIGVKEAIINNHLSRDKLIELRERIDFLAKKYEDLSFISVADSLILKSNWHVGYFNKGIKSSYKPEIILYVVKELKEIYKDVLGLDIYAVLTQGSNEYYGESLLHISESKNHVCLNSLGVPFAELLAIEKTAKEAIKSGIHSPKQLYIDEQFYHSLEFKFEFDKNEKPNYTYPAIMKSRKAKYYYSTCDVLIKNLRG